MNVAELPEVLTIEETAAALRVHPTSVRRMCRSGELQCVKVLGRWRVPKTEVLRMLQPVHLAGGRELPREVIREAVNADDDEHPRRAVARPGSGVRGDAPTLQPRIIG